MTVDENADNRTQFCSRVLKINNIFTKRSAHTIISRMGVNIVDVGVSTVRSPRYLGPLQPQLADLRTPELILAFTRLSVIVTSNKTDISPLSREV
jgi:hypothetical protein